MTQHGSSLPVDTSPHQWQHALVARPNPNVTVSYDSSVIDVSGFNVAEDNPPGITLPGYRALWVSYLPSELAQGTSEYAVTTSSSAVILQVFVVQDGVWTQVALGDSSPYGDISFSPTLYAHTQYYIRVAGKDPGIANLRILLFNAPAADIPPVPDNPLPALTLSLGSGAPFGNLPGPRPDPISFTVSVDARIPGAVDVVDLGPISATVEVPKPVPADAVPALRATVGLGLPHIVEASITLTAPAQDDVVASSTPDFVVGLTARDETLTYTIEVQYADAADLDHPVTLSASAAVVDGGAILVPGPVPATTSWRARLLRDGVEELGWSSWVTFTVDAAVETTTMPLTWTVSTRADRPIHLWHLDPPGPEAGNTVTVYGQGFPSSGHLFHGDTELSVQSWQLIPAASENIDDATRVINGDIVTCEHYEIAFIAPVDDGPGAPLTVEA